MATLNIWYKSSADSAYRKIKTISNTTEDYYILYGGNTSTRTDITLVSSIMNKWTLNTAQKYCQDNWTLHKKSDNSIVATINTAKTYCENNIIIRYGAITSNADPQYIIKDGEIMTGWSVDRLLKRWSGNMPTSTGTSGVNFAYTNIYLRDTTRPNLTYLGIKAYAEYDYDGDWHGIQASYVSTANNANVKSIINGKTVVVEAYDTNSTNREISLWLYDGYYYPQGVWSGTDYRKYNLTPSVSGTKSIMLTTINSSSTNLYFGIYNTENSLNKSTNQARGELRICNLCYY